MTHLTPSLRSTLRTAVLSGLLIAAPSLFWAQMDAPPPPDGQAEMPHGPRVDRELRQLTQVLALTDAQQAQVKDLLTAQQTQVAALFKAAQSDSSQDPSTRHQQMESIRETTNSKIAAVLDDTQKQKFSAWLAQQKNRRGRHSMSEEDMPPGPPPDGAGGPPPPGI